MYEVKYLGQLSPRRGQNYKVRWMHKSSEDQNIYNL